VNVNIITNPAARRLLVPAPVLKRVGDRTVVLVVEAGQARQKIVVTRPPTTQGVPILSGVSATDRLIANTQGVQPGDAVRVAAPPREVQP
jgi:hypothetical protein